MIPKQYGGVTIEKRRVARRTAMLSALQCGGVSGKFEEGGSSDDNSVCINNFGL